MPPGVRRVAGRSRPRPVRAAAVVPAPGHAASAERFLQETHDFYVTLDQHGVVLSWNRAAARLFGYSAAEAVGQPLHELIVPPHLQAGHLAGIARYRETGSGRGLDGAVEVTALHADGSTVPVELSIWAEHTRQGPVFHALGHDLSQRNRHQRVLEVLSAHRQALLLSEDPQRARQALCATALDALRCQGVYLYEVAGQGLLRLAAQAVDRADTAGQEVPLGEVLLQRLQRPDSFRLTVPDLGPDAASAVLRDTGLSSFVVQPLHRSGLVGVLVLGWYDVGHSPELAERALIGLLTAEALLVLERLEAQEELRRAAATDPLTGLRNRRSFDADLAAAVRVACAPPRQPLALAVLDLDGFKGVNDSLGHPAGDALLVAVARAWTAALPPGAGLYRTGGDEFALVLPGCDERTAHAAAARLRAVTPPPVGVTVGVADLVDGHGAEDLLQRADAALYVAKRRRA